MPKAAASEAGDAEEVGAASLGTSPSSWEDKGFQELKLGFWLCASPALLCGQGAGLYSAGL